MFLICEWPMKIPFMNTFMMEGRLKLDRINKFNIRVGNKKACALDVRCHMMSLLQKHVNN